MPPADDAVPARPRHLRFPNEQGLLALGEAIERRGSRHVVGARSRQRRRTRRVWARRGAVALSILLVVAIGLGIFVWIYIGGLFSRAKVLHEQQGGPGLNILLVGSTTRCGIKQNPMYGLCAEGVDGVNSDIVMIAHLQDGKASLLSIPRDLFEPNARWAPPPNVDQANKIDAALFQGPSQLVQAVEEDFGIPINHYVELNFDTFANVVNAIGGINMEFPVRVFDAESSLNIEKPGCYHLDGIHALEVVRARHLQIGWPTAGNDPRLWPQEQQSDLARIRRTHEFLRVVAAKIAATFHPSDPGSDLRLAGAIRGDLTVDDNFAESSMISLAVAYAGTNINAVPQYTYPVVEYFGDPQDAYDYFYKGYNYGEVEFPVQPGGWQAVDAIFGVAADEDPWTGKVLPLPSSFPISVLDGSGEPGQAVTVAHQLQHKGFDVTSTGVTTPVGTSSETVVWYGGPPPPKNGNWNDPAQADALRVLAELQGPATLGYNPARVSHGALVTVQTGTDLTVATRDWTAVPPPAKKHHPTTSSTTAPTVTTTTHVTPTTVYDPGLLNRDPTFSHPSDLAQPLEPWDPRACTPGQRIYLDKSGT